MSLLDWLGGGKTGRSKGEEGVAEATERLVQAMDARLRLVDGYARTLRPSVGRALRFLRERVAAVPGPVDFSPAGWRADPRVRALFASPGEMVRVFGTEPGVREFFDREFMAGECHVALFVSRIQKRSAGFSLEGDLLRGDGIAETISFSGHRLARPGGTESSVREALVGMGLDHLANRALAKIAGRRSLRQELEEEGTLLGLRLAACSRSGNGLESMMEPQAGEGLDADALRRQLDENQRRLSELGASPRTLDEYLGVLAEVLDTAADSLFLRFIELKIDGMNTVVEDPGRAGMRFCELQADGRDPRILMLARFPRSELIPRGDLEIRALAGI